MNLSVIIPAYNEEERIGDVLDIVIKSNKIDEIIVVDDGSKDNTAKVVKGYNEIKLVELDKNREKAYALAEGVDRSSYSNLLFLDADLIGLKLSHIDEQLIRTFRDENYDMVIGVFHEGKWYTDLSQKLFSTHLSGQRILSKVVWNKLEKPREKKYGIEMALTKLFWRNKNLEVQTVKLKGLSHIMKEEKRGFQQGLLSRLKMYGHIIKTTLTFNRDR